MKHRYSVFILSLMLAVGARSQEVPLLSYQWKGGHSPYKQICVVITPAGEATVSWQKYQPPLLEYRTTLSAEEIEAVHALIRSTDFFSQTGGNPVDLRDAGEIELTIQSGGQGKTMKYLRFQHWRPLRR